MTNKAAVVFTAKSIERILREGGTSDWRLHRNHALKCGFAVCTRNAKASWVEGPEAHHSAFLVGKIMDVLPSSDAKGRHLIQFSEFARVNIPGAWKGDRNPVKYASLEEIGIDPSKLKWEPMPPPTELPDPLIAAGANAPLTLVEAKRGLALTFGVPSDSIEITIRG